MNACWMGASSVPSPVCESVPPACHALASSSAVPQAPVPQAPVPGEVRQALHGDDVAALGLAGGDETGAHGHAVQADRAGTALALLAGVLGAGQAEPLAQHVQQGLALPDVVGLLGASVDGEVDAHYAAPSVMRWAPRYDSQVQVRVRRAMTPTACRR